MSHRTILGSVIAALSLAVAGCAVRPPSTGLTLSLAPGVRMELARVPAGEFIMGSTDKDVDAAYASCVKVMPNCPRTFFEPEKPQHRVYLDAYLIGKHEVTVAQFAAFVDATGYQTMAEREGKGWAFTGSKWEEVAGANWRQPQGMPTDLSKSADHPVTQVSWDDAVAFSTWASQVTSQTVRLPTEAEWEVRHEVAWRPVARSERRCHLTFCCQYPTRTGAFGNEGV